MASLCPLPEYALLTRYQQSGDYTDCFSTLLPGSFSQAQYIEAFYTTWLFRLERIILRWALSKPSTDDQARQLAHGRVVAFAAWSVEDRSEQQLLMCDIHGRTRSWLMSCPEDVHGTLGTRLYFGSAVVAPADNAGGNKRMDRGFSLLLGLHKLYSRALLHAARRRLRRVAQT